MRRPNRPLAACVLVVGAIAAGCGSGAPAADTVDAMTPGSLSAAEVAARYGYDLSSDGLSPVYALVPEYQDPRDTYARNLLLSQCMDGVAEFQVLPPSPDLDPGFEPRTHRRIFSEQIAARWGYQLPAPATPVVRPDAETYTPAVQERGLRCGERTRARLGEPPASLLGTVESAGWAAVDSSDEVRAAEEAWRACMAPAAIADLPASPNEMPPVSVVPRLSEQEQDRPAGSVVPSAREQEVAVADARCRAEADVDGAELRARAGGELAAIGRDVEAFEAVRAEYREYDARITQVIEELGG
ncbi:hypothetical protein [Blastococcus sp. SYSU D00695]